MAIFNSLGSNYNLSYISKSLLGRSGKEDSVLLEKFLEERYGGKAFLFYKGREALTFALQIPNLPKGSEVAINGFTCVAVFNAIRKEGLEPFCLDLEETGGLNFTAKTLEEGIKKNKKIKAVIVQNTFGYPCDIEAIEQICRKNKLILIEDLAHCVGTKYEDGREAGTVGDFTVLSFSQDKIIDAVSGGALIIRNKKFKLTPEGARVFHPEGRTALHLPAGTIKDRLYPHLTYKIRFLYKLGLGKPYHFLLKKLNLMSSIMNEAFYDYYNLPNWNAMLVAYQFTNLEKQLTHRRKIAQIYALSLPNKMLMYDREKTKTDVELSSNLRFPIFIDNRQSLINYLEKHGFYMSDIWYQDVAPECPNAVEFAKKILNLPTHINVSESQAKKICELINQWKRKS